MDPTRQWPIRQFKDGRVVSRTDAVVSETRIELDVNDGQVTLAMLCLPRDLEALAAGFLLGEGALRSRDDLESVEYLPQESKVAIRGDFDADVLKNMNRRWTWGTGCGGGGTSRDVDAPAHRPVGPGPGISSQRLVQLAESFRRRADLWRKTGGVHACALADTRRLLLFAEDVGRHNAFDKVVGMALFEGIDVSDKIVLATGRLSADIVSKAVAARVPILVSRSAVTSLAAELARRFGMTLVGFLRGGRLNAYSGYERVRP